MPIIVSAPVATGEIFLNISGALDEHLSNMVGLPPVAWENICYTPQKGTLYIQPLNVQGVTVPVTQDNDQTIGVYTIEIYSPSGEGKNEITAMSDTLANHFKQDTKITFNTQELSVKTVSRNAANNVYNGWLNMAVDVEYYAFSGRR